MWVQSPGTYMGPQSHENYHELRGSPMGSGPAGFSHEVHVGLGLVGGAGLGRWGLRICCE